MRITRIFTPESLSSGGELILPEPAGHHLTRVLRARVGDFLQVFDGKGHEHGAVITAIHGALVTVKVETAVVVTNESPLRITLAQGVARGERMDLIVQKATELGVADIVPVLTVRSVAKFDQTQALKKKNHWQAIAISACEQCGRAHVPPVAKPTPLSEWLARSQATTDVRLLLDSTAARSLSEQLAAPLRGADQKSVRVLIGPEGGLSQAERDAACRAGFSPVALGPRILRTETAALAALTVLQALWGDLSSPSRR